MIKSKKKRLFGKVRLSTLFLLAITLASNSFAWFIYTTKVSSNITAKVREWKVTFDANGEVVEKEIMINIDSLYPGMSDYEQTLKAMNSGETPAKITYEFISGEILGEDIIKEGYTTDQIINDLKNSYPFSIDFSLSNEVIDVDGEASITIKVTWPYESGNDEEDTLWGDKAYNYHELYPEDDSIKIVVKVMAYQMEEDGVN